MNKKPDEINSIIECLEQKKLLMTQTLNTTKQIEVQSKQKNVEVSDLVNKRQVFIDRMKKCDAFINKNINALDEKLKNQWQKIIKCCDVKTADEKEKKALKLSVEILELTKKTVSIDKVATDNIKTAYYEAKQELIKVRKLNKTDTLFKQ